jgi:hypothetical protein
MIHLNYTRAGLHAYSKPRQPCLVIAWIVPAEGGCGRAYQGVRNISHVFRNYP